MRVGIPRALLYHHYGGSWSRFMEASGVEVVLSPPTTGEIISTGATVADNETCLPVKVFTGHLYHLRDLVDYVLVPRVISMAPGTCSCPKFIGLPDMARAAGTKVPPVLSPSMDLGGRNRRWLRQWYKTARLLGGGPVRSASAVLRMNRALGPGLSYAGPVDRGCGRVKVGVAGHLYNIYDTRVSLGMLERLEEMGATSVTVDQVPSGVAEREARRLPRGVFWGFERDLAGAVLHWNRTGSVDGILFLISFACGPGSIVGALLEDQLGREGSVPFMTVTIDEHSAEAGMVTRIEAFIDMLGRADRLSVRAGYAREAALR